MHRPLPTATLPALGCLLLLAVSPVHADSPPSLEDQRAQGLEERLPEVSGDAPTPADEPAAEEEEDAPPPAQPTRWDIEVEFDRASGRVVATHDGEQLWAHRIARPGQEGRFCMPWRDGSRTFYAWEANLWETSVADGRVIDRTHLDGPCMSLHRDDGQLVVRTMGMQDVHWQREHPLHQNRNTIPPALDVTAVHLQRLAVEDLDPALREILTASSLGSPTIDEPTRAALTEAVARWREEAEFDPTNPWPRALAARSLRLLGEHDDATTEAQRLLDTPGHVDLIRVSSLLMRDFPGLSDTLFEQGLARLRETGFRPEHVRSLFTTVILLSPAPAVSDLTTDERRRWARRIEAVAPNAEGAWAFWTLHARISEAEGDVDEAARARALADGAFSSRHLGGGVDQPVPIDVRINLLFALALGLTALVLLHLVRRMGTRPWQRGTPLHRFNPLAWLPRSVTTGFAIGWLLVFVVGASIARDISVIGTVAAAPLETFSGFPGHPASVAAWEARANAGPASRAMLDWGLAVAENPSADTPAPPPDTFHRAMVEQTSGSVPNPLHATRHTTIMLDQLAASDTPLRLSVHPASLASVLFFLLALIGIGTRRPEGDDVARDEARIWHLADTAIPGFDERYGAAGPLFFAGVLTLLLCSGWLITSGGEYMGLLGAIATPSIGAPYGLDPADLTAFVAPSWSALAHAGWLIIALHAGWQFARRALESGDENTDGDTAAPTSTIAQVMVLMLVLGAAACGGPESDGHADTDGPGDTQPSGTNDGSDAPTRSGTPGSSTAPTVTPTSPPPPPPSTCEPVLTPVDTSAPDHVVGDGTPGSCTEEALREGVSAGGIVTFNCGEESAVIAITAELTPPTDRDTVVDGGGSVTLDGGRGEGRRTRIFHLHSPDYRATETRLVLQGLTLQNAHAPAEDFTPQDPDNERCAWGYRDGEGGAVRVRDARLHVIDSVFIGNRAAETGPDTGGGAIFAVGALEVVVEGSTFIDNRGSNGGAIALLQSDGVFSNSVFRDSRATGTGLNFGGASECPEFNHAAQGGAGGNGGAIVIDGGSVERVSLCGVEISGSRAGGLGTLFRTPNSHRGSTTLHRVWFHDNQTEAGGGALWMQDMALEITASTFSNNSANGLGGGIRLDQGPHGSTLLLENSTVYGNVAHESLGGGLVFSGEGHVRNVTFAGNEAAGGEGFFGAAIVAHGDGFVNVRVDNTLFSDNLDDHQWTPMTCSIRNPGNPGMFPGSGNLQWPRVRHGDGNVDDNPCTEGTTFADPLLGELGDHGGPTPTLVPGEGSPAIGAGENCPAEDQRGNPRQGGSCTAGAVEVQ